MIKRVVLHDLDYNWLAPCKEWYYKAHALQIVRRYGPWLARFESFRPAPFPAGARGEEHGYTNWLCTVGCWRELPGRWRPGDTAEAQRLGRPRYACRTGGGAVRA